MLTPKSETELAENVASAEGPLSIQGGATRGVAVEGTPLSTTELRGITIYEPGALTVVAKSGTPMSEIEAALDAENQMLAFEPMDHRALLGLEGEPTIGGVVATNTSGPRRVQAGACRDFLLGTRFVDGSGTVIKNGGRVMKNVTGYDLSRLMCGAHGTLGVLSEVSLKVLPKPSNSATLVFNGTDLGEASGLFSAAMATPFEVNGAARLPDGRALLRIEGFAEQVRYRSEALAKMLKDEFGSADEIVDEASIWRDVRDVEPFADKKGDIWRLAIKPSDLPRLAYVSDPSDMLVDWAGGRVWVRVEENTDLRSKLAPVAGHATLVRGDAHTKFEPEIDALAAMARALREKYDPRGILNPGLMGR